MAEIGTFTYFPLMAKGLAPALCAELSGLSYKSNRTTGFGFEQWPDLKASGKLPFGQLPILETGDMVIAQAVAICNYIGKLAGTEGKDAKEYALSQMLMCEGEDLYNLMQKWQPTCIVKEKPEDPKFWTETFPQHIDQLEALVKPDGSFTSTGTTTGELYLFAVLHQAVVVTPDVMKAAPKLQKWYDDTKANPQVALVLAGESEWGVLGQYFLARE